MPEPLIALLPALVGLALGLGLGWTLARRTARVQLARLEGELAAALRSARTDPLTGLSNRAAFEEFAPRQLALADRHGAPLALLLFDVDQLKGINDTAGHAAGDASLRHVAQALRDCTRKSDLAVRLSGDEFALLLPQTTSSGAAAVARRIRAQLANDPLTNPHAIPVQISGGIASHRAGESWEQLLERADRALYRAKQGGRDRVWLDDGDASSDCTSDTRPTPAA